MQAEHSDDVKYILQLAACVLVAVLFWKISVSVVIFTVSCITLHVLFVITPCMGFNFQYSHC